MTKRLSVRDDISLVDIRKRESREKRKSVADRIRAVRIAKEGELQYQEIAKLLGKKDRNYACKWIKRFNEEGFEGFETKEGQGRDPELNETEQAQIDEWMKDPGKHGYNVWNAPRLQKKIAEEFGKSLSETPVYGVLKKLGYKHRKARPTPSKANKEDLEAFKKNSWMT